MNNYRTKNIHISSVYPQTQPSGDAPGSQPNKKFPRGIIYPPSQPNGDAPGSQSPKRV